MVFPKGGYLDKSLMLACAIGLGLVAASAHRLTPFMWVAAFSYFLLCAGVFLRRQKQIHVVIMCLAIGIDLAVVATLQVLRDAVQTAVAFTLAPIQQGHVLTSATATFLYLPVLFLGWALWRNPSRSTKLRTPHITLGLAALICRTLGFFLMFSLLVSCSLLSPLPKAAPLRERLNAFPTKGLPVSQSVQISWNDYQIPFIDAQTDSDAAFALGMVHAHLRLGQLELLRRLSAGRAAEMAGPFATKIDHALRVLNLGAAVPEMEKQLPATTRQWIERFVEGINTYVARSKELPYEFRALGLSVEPWTVADVLRLSRLAGADVSWFRLLNYFLLKDEKGFDTFWDKYQKSKAETVAQGPALDALELFSLFSRSGSNSLVMGAERSESGAPLIANDPHLGILVPNLWLILGIRCPSIEAVGMSIPGLPFVALGRNKHLAWGGTNMHAQSSDLFDVSTLKAEDIQTRDEKISVRWWFDSTVQVRTTAYGPILNDIPLLKKALGETPLALNWVGHRPSDEITAFLKLNRAASAKELQDAFSSYSVSGQNILYASTSGDIGQIYAVRVPTRTPTSSASGVRSAQDPQQAWGTFLGPLDFKPISNPSSGLIVSANNAPTPALPALGSFFSSPQRALRLTKLINEKPKWNVGALSKVQLDVHSEASVRLNLVLVSLLEGAPEPRVRQTEKLLAQWQGTYETDSQAAAAYQTMVASLMRKVFEKDLSEKLIEFLLSAEGGQDFLANELKARRLELQPLVQAAAMELPDPLPAWGDIHRLQIAHPLSNVPLIGGKFVFANLPASGSIETVNKTAHGITDKRHNTRYGAQARHITDLAGPDSNHFLLLGGQDGWIGSNNLIDQVEMWQKGELIQVPLSRSGVARLLPHRMQLSR